MIIEISKNFGDSVQPSHIYYEMAGLDGLSGAGWTLFSVVVMLAAGAVVAALKSGAITNALAKLKLTNNRLKRLFGTLKATKKKSEQGFDRAVASREDLDYRITVGESWDEIIRSLAGYISDEIRVENSALHEAQKHGILVFNGHKLSSKDPNVSIFDVLRDPKSSLQYCANSAEGVSEKEADRATSLLNEKINLFRRDDETLRRSHNITLQRACEEGFPEVSLQAAALLSEWPKDMDEIFYTSGMIRDLVEDFHNAIEQPENNNSSILMSSYQENKGRENRQNAIEADINYITSYMEENFYILYLRSNYLREARKHIDLSCDRGRPEHEIMKHQNHAQEYLSAVAKHDDGLKWNLVAHIGPPTPDDAKAANQFISDYPYSDPEDKKHIIDKISDKNNPITLTEWNESAPWAIKGLLAHRLAVLSGHAPSRGHAKNTHPPRGKGLARLSLR